MNLKDLKPVGTLADLTGTKLILYGPPGTGKTPMIASLPAATTVMMATEAGLSSVRGWGKIPAWEGYNFDNIEAFRAWFVGSREADRFHTGVIDSLTKLAEIVLHYYEARTKDGRKAYGDMAKYVLTFVNQLAFMPRKNIIFTCQMATEEVIVPGQGFNAQPTIRNYNRPLFDGKVLDKKLAHAIDEIWYIHRTQRPDNTFGPAIATTDTGIAMARSRACRVGPDGSFVPKLNPLEPADLNYLFHKINS